MERVARSSALALGLLLVGAGAASAAPLSVGGLTVARPGATVDGLTVADRAVQWGRFIYDRPTFTVPGLDSPYDPGPLEKKGTSFLYGASPFESPFATLKAVVRPGQDLLLPAQPSIAFTFNESETLDVLKGQAADNAKSFKATYDLKITINGVDFETATGRDPFDFRERYPSSATDPNVGLNNPETSWVLNFVDPDEVDSSFGKTVVADGYWILFKDIAFGKNEIVVTATDRASGAELFEVTHEISAVPLPAGLVLMLGGIAALGAVGFRGRSGSA